MGLRPAFFAPLAPHRKLLNQNQFRLARARWPIPSATSRRLKARLLASTWPALRPTGAGRTTTRAGIKAPPVSIFTRGHAPWIPTSIPYGSVVQIPGIGKFLAVDTGTAVVSRRAARLGGHNKAECNAVVVDLFFESRQACEKFIASGPQYAAITWWKPTVDKAARIGGLVAANDRALLAKTL